MLLDSRGVLIPKTISLALLLVTAIDTTWGHPCSRCHAAEVKAYSETGMASSLSLTAAGPAGKVEHAYSHSQVSIEYSGALMHQRLSRGGLAADYPIAYVIGSGHRALGFLVQLGNYLFQSPVTYYTQSKSWGMAPGYAENVAPDFNRPVTSECLFCHSGQANHVRGTENRYRNPAVEVIGIDCSRCHGPTDQHLKSPTRSNIINPARLPAELRDSVCEQCHLSGEARILNPGKEFSDFVPGKRLEDVFVTYVAAGAGERPLKVISHSEQLHLSRCWQKSEQRLWCGTCHNPHVKLVEQAGYYRAKCLGCHSQTLPKEHQAADANCVGCHMPVRGTIDGAHTAFTDHQIRRQPVGQELNPPEVTQLAAWRRAPDEYAARDLGLAYLSVGERIKSTAMFQQAFEALVDVQKHSPKDPEVTAGLALILYLKGLNRQAATAFELAAQLGPAVRFYRDAAAAWQANGNFGNAIRDLNAAIEADPSDENSYRMLADLFRVTGDTAGEQRIVDKYLAFRPQSIEFRQRRTGHDSARP